jgi:hypothetical protein
MVRKDDKSSKRLSRNEAPAADIQCNVTADPR